MTAENICSVRGDFVERVILHSDANAFYASCECLYRPEIREKPVAVCGDPEARHGIILAKNQIAKKYKIQTGEVIWEAKQKCPGLVLVPANFSLYMHMSGQLRKIYDEYTDKVEPFGLDECWLDISAPGRTIEDGAQIADEIRARIREELGITVSIGVSYNKIFAKLGSDYKKPDATTAISRENYQSIVWPLPASDLLYVGRRTQAKLKARMVYTIGDIANYDTESIRFLLGKNGVMLKYFALGLDTSPVSPATHEVAIKSVGNSATLPHDVENDDDAASVFYMLAESVGARLREHGFKSKCISISVRTTDLVGYSCQRTIAKPTFLTGDIAKTALALYKERYRDKAPFRSVGISCGSLVPDDAPEQVDVFFTAEEQMRREALERALDGLRQRFGHQVVRRGVVLADRMYAAVNPKEEHTIHPVAFLKGAS